VSHAGALDAQAPESPAPPQREEVAMMHHSTTTTRDDRAWFDPDAAA
jgi:hypothetical protein